MNVTTDMTFVRMM